MNAPTGPSPELPPELPVQFKGREIWVKMPSPEQLLVWRRTLRQLQNGDTDDWNAERVMNALERSRKVIDSVLANPPDVDWLDDQMLGGSITLVDTSDLIQQAVEAFAEAAESEGNRETRRAAKKTGGKKATRKAPNRKAGT